MICSLVKFHHRTFNYSCISATYKTLVAAICTLYMTSLLLVAEAQSSSTLTYTLLKLHTFKTKAELCKNQYVSEFPAYGKASRSWATRGLSTKYWLPWLGLPGLRLPGTRVKATWVRATIGMATRIRATRVGLPGVWLPELGLPPEVCVMSTKVRLPGLRLPEVKLP